MSPAPINLFGLDRPSLRAAFADMGEKPFRADQVMQWIYRRGVDDFEQMSNLSKGLRQTLRERFVIRTPELVTEQQSQDGTRKWVLRLDGGNAIETVYIPEGDLRDGAGGDEADAADPPGRFRGTLCISSQVGCAMDCSFCSTAQQGFNRNLSSAEIIAQVWFAARALGGDFQNERVISNVVFMGMGEPLANYTPVLAAIRVLLDDFGFGLSKRRVTVSTSGLVPFIDRLRDDVDTALAVSLHAPSDELRNTLVPINRKYPIAELARLLSGMQAKVNLIPFNPFPETRYRRSRPETIRAFSEILRSRRIVTTTRKTRGDDIDAACGQLVGKVQSRQKQRLGDIAVRSLTT
jgi:23S rRNA (adenine2503-C2)-methyltransferase